MKKAIILFLFFICVTVLNVLSIDMKISFMDYNNLLFFNANALEDYGLNALNYKYIITFYFFVIILLYFILSYVNENQSFFNMVIYRKGRKETVKDILKYNIIILMKYYILLNIVIISISAFMPNISIKENIIYDELVFNIYLIRLLLLLFIFIMNNTYDSLNDKYCISVTKLCLLPLLLIFIDILLHINLITFSGNIIFELGYLFFYLCVTVIYYHTRLMKGEKNDRG